MSAFLSSSLGNHRSPPRRHGAISHRFLTRANKTWIDHTPDRFKNLFTQEGFFFRPPETTLLIDWDCREDGLCCLPPLLVISVWITGAGSPGAAFPSSHPFRKWGFSSRFLTKPQPHIAGVVSAFSLAPHSTLMGRRTGCNDECKIFPFGRWGPLCLSGFFTIFHLSDSITLPIWAVYYLNNDTTFFFLCCLNPGMGRTRGFPKHEFHQGLK